MTFLDDALRPVVSTVVDVFGATLQIREKTNPTYDPTTGDETEDPPVLYTKKGIPPQNVTTNFEGAEVEALEVDIPGIDLSFEPTPEKHAVILNGKEYRIMKVGAIYTGQLVALWQVFLHK